MPYKDEKYGTWYCKFQYTDWTGARKQKKKTGFARKKDAEEWEREYLAKSSNSCDMTFRSLAELYMADYRKRLRLTTAERKDHIFRQKLIPYFGALPINEITPFQIRSWQNEMMSSKQNDGKGYAKTYLHAVNGELSAVFNYAMKYFNLPSNPVHLAGSMGAKNPDEMLFWTEPEFKSFISCVTSPTPYCVFCILFYTGIREGELLALTLDDFDFDAKILHITKTFSVIHGEEYIGEPKTKKSRRDITLPDFLCEIVKDYSSRLVDYEPHERLFPYTKSWVNHQMINWCKKSGVKKIRVHDLRHSHASLLINMGCPILVVSQRLGHENIETTLQKYGHLYPDVHGNVASSLDEKSSDGLSPDAWKNHGLGNEN